MSERIIIRNGTVVTMNDAADVVFDGTVVLDGDRITDVGKTSDVLARQTAEGARIIDASGKAVLPGLVDLHCILGRPGQLQRVDQMRRHDRQ